MRTSNEKSISRLCSFCIHGCDQRRSESVQTGKEDKIIYVEERVENLETKKRVSEVLDRKEWTQWMCFKWKNPGYR